MAWYLIALGSAVLLAFSDVFRKRVLQKEHAMEFAVGRSILMAFLALLLIPWVDFSLDVTLISLIFAISTVAVFAQLYTSKALRHGDISVVVPAMNVEPVIVLILSFLLLGENPSLLQGTGVFVIMLGAYAIKIESKHDSLLEPLHKLLNDHSLKFLLIGVIILGCVNVANKYVFNNFPIHFATYLFYTSLFIAIVFAVIDSQKYGLKEVFSDLFNDEPGIFFAAAFFFLSLLFYFWAISIPEALVSLALPLRRTSALFSTFIGGRMFHEENLHVKIIATLVMITGVVLIVI